VEGRYIRANGIRAWATIFAAQYVGAERAAGIDHLIYGWIFFGLVIAAVLALSWRHFDRAIGEPACDAAALTVDPRFARWEDPARGPAKGVLLAGVILMGGLAWSQAAQGLIAPIPRQIHLPDVAGWERTDFMAQAAWEPQAAGADHRLLGSYASPSGQRVEVFYALYADQGEGREAAGFGQGALVPGGDWSWASAGPLVPEGRSDRLVYLGATERLAFTWYRSGALLTGSKVRLKLANIADRVALRPRATAVLILSAERSKGNDPQAAIAAFSGAIGPIGPWMDQIGEGR
jgi:EpsI family protein